MPEFGGGSAGVQSVTRTAPPVTTRRLGVADAVDDAGLAALAEYDGHPSVRSLVDDDYEVITF